MFRRMTTIDKFRWKKDKNGYIVMYIDESGIEKLQELLKEYQLSKGEWVRLAGPDVEVNDKEELVLEATLISKKYGFIQWLVENEKIKWNERFYLEDDEGLFGTYECLLMQLAIQDEPIEFLVSILK